MILDALLREAERAAAARERLRPFEQIEKSLAEVDAPVGFAEAIRQAQGIGLIAELKPASPSAGVLRDPFPVEELARQLRTGGADCLSVLTEEKSFRGSLENLKRASVAGLPRLQKDFVLNEYQVLEGRAAGADAILLIAEALSPARARELGGLALSLGMDVLYEAHGDAGIRQVEDYAATAPDRILVGINNRDLRTFHVDLEVTLRAAQRLAETFFVVGESGIRTAADVARLRDAGVRGMLVGESLMRQADVSQAVRTLLAGVRLPPEPTP